MKVIIYSRTWSEEDLEHGETFNDWEEEYLDIRSVDELADMMREFTHPSQFPIQPGVNFWLSSEPSTDDFCIGGSEEKSLHMLNPTPYNINLWHKAFAKRK